MFSLDGLSLGDTGVLVMLLLLAVRVHLKDLLISVVYKQGCLQTFQYNMASFCTIIFRIN